MTRRFRAERDRDAGADNLAKKPRLCKHPLQQEISTTRMRTDSMTDLAEKMSAFLLWAALMSL
jgi:hypothetical protein